MKNQVYAGFGASNSCVTSPRYQYDYGQVLILKGLRLPESYEVHFSNSESGQAKTQIGDSDGVVIPDEYFLTGQDIFAWVYIHEGNDNGRTIYKVRIPVKRRPEISNAEPTPVQQDVITQAIALLNSAVAKTEENISRYPKIENGTWHVWDAENGEWTDTGITAHGDTGDTGNGIASVSLNPDYTLTLTFTDGAETTTEPIRGERGLKGDKGDKGDPGQSVFFSDPNDDGHIIITNV